MFPRSTSYDWINSRAAPRCLRQVFADVLTLDVEDDGLAFDIDSLDVGPIREDQVYGGVRIVTFAKIVSARIRLQIGVGFGDAITPEAITTEYPTLLDFPAPTLRAYPRETVAAIVATFDRRGTPLPKGLLVALTPEFANDTTKNTQWTAFLRRSGTSNTDDLATVVAVITAFAERPLAAASGAQSFAADWTPGGRWKTTL